MNIQKPPKVFVSYSHDSKGYKEWIKKLCLRLSENGVEVILDQWSLNYGQDLRIFMDAGIQQSDKIIVACSEEYVNKCKKYSGGASYETAIMSYEYVNDQTTEKAIPIIKNNPAKIKPPFLLNKLHIDFDFDLDYESKFDQLLRTIYNEPILKKPEIGTNPFLSQQSVNDVKKFPSISDRILKIVAIYYDMGYHHHNSLAIAKELKLSRFLLEDEINEMFLYGLIEGDIHDFWITNEGFKYIKENKLYTE